MDTTPAPAADVQLGAQDRATIAAAAAYEAARRRMNRLLALYSDAERRDDRSALLRLYKLEAAQAERLHALAEDLLALHPFTAEAVAAKRRACATLLRETFDGITTREARAWRFLEATDPAADPAERAELARPKRRGTDARAIAAAAELVANIAEGDRVSALYPSRAPVDVEERMRQRVDRFHELVDRLADMRPATPAAVRAMALAAQRAMAHSADDLEGQERLAWQVLGAVARMVPDAPVPASADTARGC